MSETYDVVVAGAGHNGLIVAAYLAKAGLDVCVVEHQPYVGGGVITRELTIPGFKHDLCSTLHFWIIPNPLIMNDELQLQSKFGLEYQSPEVITGLIFDDDTHLLFYQDLDKTCESISKISQHDAEAYRKFLDWSTKMLDMLLVGLYNPTPTFGTSASFMEQSEEGRQLLKATMVSALSVCDQWFENDKIKIAVSRYAAEAMLNPGTPGTGFSLFVFLPLLHKYGAGIPVGGSGQLSESLAKCIKSHGGTIKLSSTLKRFKIDAGEVSGVILESGEEILARRAVVTNFNIKQIFPDMVEGADLPPDFVRNVKNLDFSSYAPLKQDIALKEEPRYTAEEVNQAFWVEYTHTDMEDYLKAFQAIEFGYPGNDLSVGIIQTKLDKTRAPEGKHTLYLYAFEPYALKDGGAAKWDEIGQEVADGILENFRKMAINAGDENILGRHITTPLDFERHNPSFIHGDFAHIGLFFWQAGGMRPLPGWSQYRMPVKKLYMCGPSTHPGCGVIGGGRAAVQVVMEDLGIDFEEVAGK